MAPFPVSPEGGKAARLIKNFEFRIMNFFDKQAQCQTRLSNVERRKNARSELFAFKNAAKN